MKDAEGQSVGFSNCSECLSIHSLAIAVVVASHKIGLLEGRSELARLQTLFDLSESMVAMPVKGC